MIVLDTTVLVYVVGTDHPLRESCRRVLVAHAHRAIGAATTMKVVQEFAQVRARRRDRASAAQLAQEYAASLHLLSTTPEDLDLGLSLFGTYERLGAFDAILAATALNRAARALISADRAFGEVPNLRWINPVSRELDELLA